MPALMFTGPYLLSPDQNRAVTPTGVQNRSSATDPRPPVRRELVTTSLMTLVDRVLSTEPWERSPHVDALQRVVRTVAADMRDRGELPERMIVAIKTATATGRQLRHWTEAGRLHYRIVHWSVCEYFRCAE